MTLSSADTLRRAATLMAQRADDAYCASGTRWETYELPHDPRTWTMTGVGVPDQDLGHRADVMFKEDAEHIASWHPTVATAVAAWLDTTARGLDPDRMSLTETGPYVQAALDVARAYLGEQP